MLYFSIENARARVHKDLAIIDDGSVQIKRQLSQRNPSGRTSEAQHVRHHQDKAIGSQPITATVLIHVDDHGVASEGFFVWISHVGAERRSTSVLWLIRKKVL